MSSPPVYRLTAGRSDRLAEFLGPGWILQNLGPGNVWISSDDRHGELTGVELLPIGHVRGGPVDQLYATTDTTGTLVALVRDSLAIELFNPRIGAGGGGGIVQQGARDAPTAQEWLVSGLNVDGAVPPGLGLGLLVGGLAGAVYRSFQVSTVEPPVGQGLVVRIAGRGQQLMAASIPVVIASDQIVALSPSVGAMTWVSVKSAAPAANAVQADTGALAAGDYDFLINLAVSDTVAVGKGLVIEHRNAANGATLFNLGGCTPNGGAITILIRRYTLVLNERIRVIAGTAAGAAASMYISAIGRRIYVAGT